MRNKYLAHTDAAHLRNPERLANVRVTREEVGQSLETAKELVTVLSFGVGRSFEFMPGDDDYRMTDLITEVVIKQSHVLRLPEEQAEVFPYIWKEWSPAERDVFNEWRTRTKRLPFVGGV